MGSWVAKYREEHATDQDREKTSEAAEIAKLRAEVRELRQENESLKKAAAWLDWTAGCFSSTACFVLQAALVKPRSLRSTSFGLRYPRAE